MKKLDGFRKSLDGLNACERVEKYVAFLDAEDELDPAEIIEVAQEILRLQTGEENHAHGKIATCYLSEAYSSLGDYQQSVQYLRHILQKWGDTLEDQERAEYLDRLGTAYWKLCDYDGALKSLTEALNYFEKVDDKKRVAGLQSNMGIIHGVIDEDDKAIEYINRALETATISGDKAQQAAYMNNLGIILFKKGKEKEGLENFLESASIKEMLGDTKKLITTYLNIADSYEELEERDKVLPYIEKAMKIAEENDDIRFRARCLRSLGIHYTNNGSYQDAEKSLKEALNALHETTHTRDIARVLEFLSRLYEKKGDYRKALNCQKEQMDLDRRIYNEETARKIAETQTLYETKRKELEAELLRERMEELAKLNKEISSQHKELRVAESALKDANRELKEKMEIDSLTGLLNNHRIYEKLQDRIDLCRKNDEPLSIIMLDLDHFKTLNDQCGHPIGNMVLQEVGKTIRESIRNDDLAFRFGGEEFLVILQGKPKEVALSVAERIRKAVENMGFHEGLRTTVSGGVKQVNSEDAHELIVEADKLLYRAKDGGRNRILK